MNLYLLVDALRFTLTSHDVPHSASAEEESSEGAARNKRGRLHSIQSIHIASHPPQDLKVSFFCQLLVARLFPPLFHS